MNLTFQNYSIKSISLLIIILISSTVFSQITFVLNQPNPYHFDTKDSWNLSIINPFSMAIEAKLTATIYSSDRKKVAELTSGVIKISKGMMQINPFSFQTESVNYYDPILMQREQQGLGLLPGKYNLCIYAECSTQDCNGVGSNSITFENPLCETIVVENPTPLILVNPEHKSEIEETRPILVWQPPSPIFPGTPMIYWVTLTPKLENQNAIEAIRLNRPLFTVPVEQNNMLVFPQDIPPLERGHEYVWQVEAKVNDNPTAISEVWQFKIKKEEKKIIPKLFVKINDVRNDFYPVEDTLRFTYIEDRFAQNSISYSILSNDGSELRSSTELPCASGENRYMIDLRPLGLTDGENYTLVILTPAKTSLPLKFTFYSSGN